MLKKIILSILLMALFMNWGIVSSQPHQSRTGANILGNPTLSGLQGWTILGGTYDGGISKDVGSGSVKLFGADHQVFSPIFLVTPGIQYTISVYIRTDRTPFSGLVLFGGVYNSTGDFIRNFDGSRIANSKRDIWEESTILYTPEDGETRMQIKAYYVGEQPNGSFGPIWVDNLYVGTGPGFQSPPAPKTAFSGPHARIDALGNYTRLEDGTWKPFFPFCMFPDNRRSDWTIYAKQGFNCNIWGANVTSVRAHKALGLLSAIDLSPYINPEGWAFQNWDGLESMLIALKNSPEFKNVLFLYWDNENSWLQFQEGKIATDIARHIVPGLPIYVLQGNHGMARAFKNDTYNMTDIVGTYVDGNSGGAAGSSGGLYLLDHSENQTNPVFLAQINLGAGKNFRPRLWAAISRGAKAMGYWADLVGPNTGGSTNVGDSNSVESRPWWNEFPETARQINMLLPVIHQPHWVSWRVSTSVKHLDIGMREYQGESYLFISNSTSNNVNSAFTISHHSAFSQVKDAITNAVITNADRNSFSLIVEAHGVRLIKFKGTGVVAHLSPQRNDMQDIIENYKE